MQGKIGSLFEINGVRGVVLTADEFERIASLLHDLASFAEGEMILGRYVDDDDFILENVSKTMLELSSGKVELRVNV